MKIFTLQLFVILLFWRCDVSFGDELADLPENRVLLFNDYVLTNNAPVPTWVHEGRMPLSIAPVIKALLAGTNHFHRTGWTLFSCRAGSAAYKAGAFSVPPKSPDATPIYPAVASNLAANLCNDLSARIESPVFTNGIGTLYFEAINQFDYLPTQITVDFATNMVDGASGTLVPTLTPESTNGLDYVWETLSVLELSAATSNDFVRYSRTLNCRCPAKVRIRRTGSVYEGYNPDDCFSIVDNIRVSLPPSDVVIAQTACAFEPGYPSVGTNLTVRCTVGNLDTNAPTTSRAVKVISRWRYLDQQVGAWQTNVMAHAEGTGDGLGNGEVYEAVLPPQSAAGDLEYFFVCAFDGMCYVSPDYTGTGLNGYPYATESASPRVLRGTAGEFSVRVRPYASEFGAVSMVCDEIEGTVGMELVADHVWRALVPVKALGLTNLTWCFRASGAYEPASYSVSTGITYWAAGGLASPRFVPFAGACLPDTGEGRLALRADGCGYVMVTLNTRTLAYEVRRAEAQDFNAWPARADVFTASSGQVAKQSFLNPFNAWPTNDTTVCREAVGAVVGSTNVFMSGPFQTPSQWVGGGAAYVSERPFDVLYAPEGATKFRNQALRLKGGDGVLDLGYLRNAPATLTDGVKDVTFKCRLSQGFGASDIVYYREGFTNFNYLVRATARAVSVSQLSPGNPTISLIGYYTDPDHFYEYRVVQINDPVDSVGFTSDRRIRHELYKWENGVATLIGTPKELTTSTSPLIYITDAAPLEIRLFNETTEPVGTRIRCRYANADQISYLDTSSPYTNGTFGYVSSDCGSSLSFVQTKGTLTGANESAGTEITVLRSDPFYDTDVARWYLPAGRYVLKNNVMPKGIYSVVPVQPLGIYVQAADDTSGAEPGLNWRLIKQVDVTNFTYQTVSVSMNEWRPQFVKLQVMGGTCDVVVDEAAVASWRARDVGDAGPGGWLATEAWVVSNSSDRAQVVQLDHARADPLAVQGVRSPLVLTGLGVLEFDCRVLRAPALLTVQYVRQAQPDVWTEVRAFSVTNAAGWVHLSAYLGLAESGYFRVVNTRAGACTNALVEIDNALVWDEPTVDDTSWKAYNAKITAADVARVSLDQSKACFLNNSQTAEADPVQDVAEPYVQSPLLCNGVGLFSFSARAYDPGQSATVFAYASTNGWKAPESQWFEIARFENITNSLYTRFTYDVPAGFDCDSVRLMTSTGSGAQRVCIEDVVVAEPLTYAADLVGVWAWPQDQTITRSDTSVDVTIRLAGNFALRQTEAGAPETGYPRLGVIVNNEVAWAPLHHLSTVPTPGGGRTDAVFRYAVRPGDMAAPLRLAGSGRPRDPYHFDWKGWEIFNLATSSNAVWRFNPSLMLATDAYDPDLTRAGVTLCTLAFEVADTEWVPATGQVTWRVRTDRDVGGAPFQIQVWSPHTNLVRFGAAPGEPTLRLDVVSAGPTATCSEATFTVHGLAEGLAEIIVQRVGDYAANAARGVGNEIRRSVSVTPQPLSRWSEIAGTLKVGGLFTVAGCTPDAAGATVVCDGGGAGSVFRFVSDASVVFTNLTIVISNGATVVFENVAVDNRSVEELSAVYAADACPENGLALIGRNAVYGGDLAAGLHVPAGASETNRLTISSWSDAQGELLVCGGKLSAGIGGAPFEAAGRISVQGRAVVSVWGGEFGAGIGGGIAASGGALEVADEAVVLATGGGGVACDVGFGAYGSGPAQVDLTGGLLLSGSGVGGVSAFVSDRHTSRSLGVFEPCGCWYELFRNGAEPLGWLYVAKQTVGLHMVSNVSPEGAYLISAVGGGAEVPFEIARSGAVIPSGVHRETEFYCVWLDQNGLGESDLSALSPALFDTAWLLDQNPLEFVAGELALTGVEKGADSMRVTFTVRAATPSGMQAVAHLNGRLTAWGTWSLEEPFTEIAEITGTFAEGEGVFEIPHPVSARFVKLVLAFPDE